MWKKYSTDQDKAVKAGSEGTIMKQTLAIIHTVFPFESSSDQKSSDEMVDLFRLGALKAFLHVPNLHLQNGH